MKVILASGSKQRQNILNMIGLKYEVITSSIEEKSNEKEPSKYVEELSLNKAISVSNQIQEKAIIIAADTVIYSNNKIYEKPKTKEEAFQNMKELSANTSIAYTGVTIIDLYQNKTLKFSTATEVKLTNMSDNEIQWYVNNEKNIFNCCGYVPEGKAAIFIEKIIGDYNNLIGISPNVLFSKFKELGYQISDFEFNAR